MDELSSNGTGVIAFCNQITKCSLDVNLTNFLHFAAATEVRHDKSGSRFSNTSAPTSVIHWPQFIIIIAEACGLSHPSPRDVAAGLLGGEGGVAVQHHLLDVHLWHTTGRKDLFNTVHFARLPLQNRAVNKVKSQLVYHSYRNIWKAAGGSGGSAVCVSAPSVSLSEILELLSWVGRFNWSSN